MHDNRQCKRPPARQPRHIRRGSGALSIDISLRRNEQVAWARFGLMHRKTRRGEDLSSRVRSQTAGVLLPNAVR
jgi:hypothetical protein